MGATTVAGVVFGSAIDNNKFGLAIAIVGSIPAVASFYSFIGSYIYELIDQRSIRNGWIFKVEQYESFK